MSVQVPKLSDKIPGCQYFTWKEALWLSSWNRAATADELSKDILDNLTDLFQRLDKVRKYFGKPITVTICLRTMKYHLDLYARINAKRKKEGKPALRIPMGSAHLSGQGVDFIVHGLKCHDARQMILKDKKLEEWGMRMEDIEGEWIHLDTKPVINKRFFKP